MTWMKESSFEASKAKIIQLSPDKLYIHSIIILKRRYVCLFAHWHNCVFPSNNVTQIPTHFMPSIIYHTHVIFIIMSCYHQLSCIPFYDSKLLQKSECSRVVFRVRNSMVFRGSGVSMYLEFVTVDFSTKCIINGWKAM